MYDPAAPRWKFYAPFRAAWLPVQRLLRVDFEGDPQYTALEARAYPQGLAALLHRRDQRVDVYAQPGFHLGQDDVPGAELGPWQETPFSAALFPTSPGGEAHIALCDSAGQSIELHARLGETAGRPFDLLSPLGVSCAAPQFFPYFYLYQANLLRRSALSLRIAGEPRRPADLPLPLWGRLPLADRRACLALDCPDPFLLLWNPAGTSTLEAAYPAGPGKFHSCDLRYTLEEQAGHFEIDQFVFDPVPGGPRKLPPHRFGMTFDPPLPDITALADGAAVRGRFLAWREARAITFSGVYQVARQGAQSRLTLEITSSFAVPSASAVPNGSAVPSVSAVPGASAVPSGSAVLSGWLLRLLYLLRPGLRRWPAAYRWTATIDLSPGQPPRLHSAWERTQPPGKGRPA